MMRIFPALKLLERKQHFGQVKVSQIRLKIKQQFYQVDKYVGGCA
jgi:hypothetical protein